MAHYLAAAQAAVAAEVADIEDVPAALADSCVVRVVSHMRQSEQNSKFAGSSMRLSGARATLRDRVADHAVEADRAEQ